MTDDPNHDPSVAARMPRELIDRLEELKPLLKQLPEHQTRKLTRSELIRLAVAHGIQRLEEVLVDRDVQSEQVDLLESPQEDLPD
jgi:predicted DNA-binding protein